MKCRYITDEVAEKVLIPGCWGAAVFGIEHCMCYDREPKEIDERGKLIKELEKENARLSRIIYKLTNRKLNQ